MRSTQRFQRSHSPFLPSRTRSAGGGTPRSSAPPHDAMRRCYSSAGVAVLATRGLRVSVDAVRREDLLARLALLVVVVHGRGLRRRRVVVLGHSWFLLSSSAPATALLSEGLCGSW